MKDNKEISIKADAIIEIIDVTVNKAVNGDLDFNQYLQTITSVIKEMYSFSEDVKNSNTLSLENLLKLNSIQSKFETLRALNLKFEKDASEFLKNNPNAVQNFEDALNKNNLN